jgi:hypothetical protein
MNKHSFEKLEEKLGNEKTMISKAQLASAISDVVTTTLVATVPIGTSIQACAIAAAETKRVLDDFFLAGEPEKKTEDVPDTEKDAKFDDLKHLLFKSAAIWSLPSKTVIEDQRTAEIRRSAKQMTLLSLISEAGLTDEYHEWLRENGYE